MFLSSKTLSSSYSKCSQWCLSFEISFCSLFAFKMLLSRSHILTLFCYNLWNSSLISAVSFPLTANTETLEIRLTFSFLVSQWSKSGIVKGWVIAIPHHRGKLDNWLRWDTNKKLKITTMNSIISVYCKSGQVLFVSMATFRRKKCAVFTLRESNLFFGVFQYQ